MRGRKADVEEGNRALKGRENYDARYEESPGSPGGQATGTQLVSAPEKMGHKVRFTFRSNMG